MSNLRFIATSSLLFLAIASTLITAFHCKGRRNYVGIVAASKEVDQPKKVYVVAAAAAARDKTLRSPKMVVHKTGIPNMKMNTKLMVRGKRTSSFRRIILSGNKNENFVAFTEDYHPPRHHPPKNN